MKSIKNVANYRSSEICENYKKTRLSHYQNCSNKLHLTLFDFVFHEAFFHLSKNNISTAKFIFFTTDLDSLLCW